MIDYAGNIRRNCIYQRAKGTDRDNGYPEGEHTRDCDLCQGANEIERLTALLDAEMDSNHRLTARELELTAESNALQEGLERALLDMAEARNECKAKDANLDLLRAVIDERDYQIESLTAEGAKKNERIALLVGASQAVCDDADYDEDTDCCSVSIPPLEHLKNVLENNRIFPVHDKQRPVYKSRTYWGGDDVLVANRKKPASGVAQPEQADELLTNASNPSRSQQKRLNIQQGKPIDEGVYPDANKQWAKEKPTKPGYYYWRQGNRIEPCEVRDVGNEDLEAWFIGERDPLVEWQWQPDWLWAAMTVPADDGQSKTFNTCDKQLFKEPKQCAEVKDPEAGDGTRTAPPFDDEQHETDDHLYCEHPNTDHAPGLSRASIWCNDCHSWVVKPDGSKQCADPTHSARGCNTCDLDDPAERV